MVYVDKTDPSTLHYCIKNLLFTNNWNWVLILSLGGLCDFRCFAYFLFSNAENSIYPKVLAEWARRYFRFFWCNSSCPLNLAEFWLDGKPYNKKVQIAYLYFSNTLRNSSRVDPTRWHPITFSPCPLLFCRYFLLSPSYSLAFNLLSPPLKQMHQILWFANFIVFSRFISLILHAVFWRRSYPILHVSFMLTSLDFLHCFVKEP